MTMYALLSLLLLQFSTSTFTFKNTYNIPGSDLKEISYFLETEYSHLKDRFHLNRKKKIEIFFYNSTDEFVRHTGANRRIGAIYNNNRISLQPIKLLRQRRILLDVVRHELIHALLDGDDNKKIPKWLNEAFSIFESGELNRVKKRTAIKFTSLNELESCLYSKDYKVIETSYFYLGLAMQYMIKQYGEEKVTGLINEKKDLKFELLFSEITGESFQKAENKIIKYITSF